MLGLSFAVAMGLLMLCLPRRLALLPIILTICYMTIGQQVMLGGLHFPIIRLMVGFGWFRLVARRELHRFSLNSVDKLLLAWQGSRMIAYTLQLGTLEGFIYVGGNAYNVLGMYFLTRFLVDGLEDLPHIAGIFAIAIMPLALLMAIEHFTQHNGFSIFGGVLPYTMIDEDGRLRCQGPFLHPILAGTFGATLLPFFFGLWFHQGRSRLVAASGFAAATAIVLTAHSSGPVVACACLVIGMVLWKFRESMRLVRWSLLCLLIALHLVMKAPVWFLMARLGSLIGGTGDHRAMLIDAAIHHFAEWWLLGTHYTAHWLPYHLAVDPTMVDMTSQFVYEGVIGGLATLCLFVALLAAAFRAIGRLVRYTNDVASFEYRIMAWCLGVGLLAHTVSLISVVYFDQNIVNLCIVLGIIAFCPSEMAACDRETWDEASSESSRAMGMTATNS